MRYANIMCVCVWMSCVDNFFSVFTIKCILKVSNGKYLITISNFRAKLHFPPDIIINADYMWACNSERREIVFYLKCTTIKLYIYRTIIHQKKANGFFQLKLIISNDTDIYKARPVFNWKTAMVQRPESTCMCCLVLCATLCVCLHTYMKL